MDNRFDIPIVLFLYKRPEKILLILDVIRQIRPSKIYLLADGPRNENEYEAVSLTRKKVLEAIDWHPIIVEHFSIKNIGVFQNIGMGAKWVFSQEKRAIFLEDDNLPEKSFFRYCEELLGKYEHDQRILWICGTNYLEQGQPLDGSDYYFTKHLLPCGWASWSDKFLKYYDQDFALFQDKSNRLCVKRSYLTTGLYTQRKRSIQREIDRYKIGIRYISWDFQMIFSIRANNLYGIAPKYNLIRNIGVDSQSTHVTKKDAVNEKFCEKRVYEMPSPLKHPEDIHIDNVFEKRIGKIILAPWYIRAAFPLTNLLKKITGNYPNKKRRG